MTDLDGSVLCLVGLGDRADELAMRIADRLAQAIEAPLATHSAPRRGAFDMPEEAERAAIVVTAAARGRVIGFIGRDRSPALATKLGMPAVLVPENATESTVSGWDGEIVCGVDRSRGARSAAQAASALATRLRLPMSLVHATEPVPPLAVASLGGGAVATPVEQLEEEARESSWELLGALDDATPKPARLRLRKGPPASCLSKYAEGREAPLIVVGAPDHGAMAALLFHSTAWELAKSAPAPVMYVPEGFAPSW